MSQKSPLIAVIVLVASSAFVLSACSEAKSSVKVAEEIVAIPVLAEPVSIGGIDATYGTTASLEAAAEAAVAARVSGVVTNIMVEEGDFVEAGQVLAQLEVDRLTLELNRASANLNQVANDLSRQQKIYEKNLVSSEAFDRIKYQFEAQKAATDLAKLNLEYATIRAPISGVISMRYIKEGNLLQQNAPAFHISDLSELYAVIHIPESEKTSLVKGQPALVLVEASDYPFMGSVLRVSPVVDKESGTIRVTVSLKDETAILRPGMFSRVKIVYDTHNKALLVPKDSVLTQDDEISVFVVEEGIAHKRNVSLGFSNSEHIEILSGIKSSDMVITAGQRNLKDESHVELINTTASEEKTIAQL